MEGFGPSGSRRADWPLLGGGRLAGMKFLVALLSKMDMGALVLLGSLQNATTAWHKPPTVA